MLKSVVNIVVICCCCCRNIVLLYHGDTVVFHLHGHKVLLMISNAKQTFKFFLAVFSELPNDFKQIKFLLLVLYRFDLFEQFYDSILFILTVEIKTLNDPSFN